MTMHQLLGFLHDDSISYGANYPALWIFRFFNLYFVTLFFFFKSNCNYDINQFQLFGVIFLSPFLHLIF